MFCHKAGFVFEHLFKIISPLIDPVTRAKLVFLPNDDAEAAAVLEREIGLEVSRQGREEGAQARMGRVECDLCWKGGTASLVRRVQCEQGWQNAWAYMTMLLH